MKSLKFHFVWIVLVSIFFLGLGIFFAVPSAYENYLNDKDTSFSPESEQSLDGKEYASVGDRYDDEGGIVSGEGHDIALSKQWSAVGHGYFQTIDGHNIALTQQWRTAGHEYDWSIGGHNTNLSQQWNAASHDYDWSIGGHNITLTQQWNTAGHRYSWSRGGHYDDLSQLWLAVGHDYSSSRMRIA